MFEHILLSAIRTSYRTIH